MCERKERTKALWDGWRCPSRYTTANNRRREIGGRSKKKYWDSKEGEEKAALFLSWHQSEDTVFISRRRRQN